MPVEASTAAGGEHDRVGTMLAGRAVLVEQLGADDPCPPRRRGRRASCARRRALPGAAPSPRGPTRSPRRSHRRPRAGCAAANAPPRARVRGPTRRGRTRRRSGSGRARAAGPSSHSTRTAAGLPSPAPASSVSAKCRSARVVGEQRRGDAALGIPGVRLGELGLGDELDLEAGVGGLRPRSRGRRCRCRPRATRVMLSGSGDRCDGPAAGGLAASMRSRASRAGSATSSGTVMRLTTRPATSSSSTQAR